MDIQTIGQAGAAITMVSLAGTLMAMNIKNRKRRLLIAVGCLGMLGGNGMLAAADRAVQPKRTVDCQTQPAECLVP